MSELAERAFVVTEEELLKLYEEELQKSRLRTAAHPGSAEKIVVMVQGGKVVEVEAPRKYRLLPKRP